MQDDGVLVQRALEGDDDAFREIVDRYKHSLVNYLTHLTRSRDRAEELAQEAFVRLYRSASSYREQSRLGPYLFRIATNLAVSAARRERRWSLLLPRLHASTRTTAPLPDAAALSNEIQRQVSAALDLLPVKYRAPLVLYEIEGWSYDEIGTALGLCGGTVKSRISRARQIMKRQLAPWWMGDRNERQTSERLDAATAAGEGIAGIHV